MAADRRSRHWIGIVLAVCLVIFVYNLISDRLTPYSSHATIQAYIVSIAPEVAGNVVEIGVVDNQAAKAGDLLFRIDPQSYEVAVREAEAAVDSAGQSIGANTAGVSAAEAAVADARAKLSNAQEQAARIFQLVERGIYAKAKGDQAKRLLEGAQAGMRQAEAHKAGTIPSSGPLWQRWSGYSSTSPIPP
jgi:multidrug resistance efflux pump